jgi:hypothetical protein
VIEALYTSLNSFDSIETEKTTTSDSNNSEYNSSGIKKTRRYSFANKNKIIDPTTIDTKICDEGLKSLLK